jgi:hypothetical protein
LPNSMSGLPALRCFIFFAADLFILVLPSFNRETLAKIGQRFLWYLPCLKSLRNVRLLKRATGILRYSRMLSKRIHAWEAS